MRNRIKKIILGSSTILIALFVSILVSCLMLLDFFGANITDNYVENNADYSSKYLSVVNKNIRPYFFLYIIACKINSVTTPMIPFAYENNSILFITIVSIEYTIA